MNTKQTLVVLGCAALCGFALAQNPKPSTPPPAERLDALEKEVATLRTLNVTASAATKEELAAVKKELAETRALANELVTWVAAQAHGAAELEHVLDESEQKGFTFGINPDSRVALLAGWRAVTAGVQKDVPKPLLADQSKTVTDPKAPARKNP